MSKAAYNKIIAKLQALDEYLRYLKELQKINKKSFLTDYHFFAPAEHYLHLAIEVVLDVSKLLVVVCEFARPEEQRELLPLLSKHHVVNEKLRDKLEGIIGFRNILIHEYEKIDKEIIYEILQKNIDQFKEFSRQVRRFLNKKSK